jgi:hypothetical protein
MKAYKLSRKDMVCVHGLLLFTWNKIMLPPFVCDANAIWRAWIGEVYAHSVACRHHLIELVPFRLSGWHLNANVCMGFKQSKRSFSLHDFLFHKAYAFFQKELTYIPSHPYYRLYVVSIVKFVFILKV